MSFVHIYANSLFKANDAISSDTQLHAGATDSRVVSSILPSHMADIRDSPHSDTLGIKNSAPVRPPSGHCHGSPTSEQASFVTTP